MKRFLLSLCICMQLCAQDDLMTLFEQANAAFSEGDCKQASSLYRHITSTRQDIPQVWFNLGVALMHTDKHQEAIESFRQAIELKDDYAKAYAMLGKCYRHLDQIDAAKHAFERAHEIDPTLYESIVPLAHIYRDNNDFKAAASLFHEAVCLKPHDLQCILELANTLNTDNQTQESLHWYYKLDEQIPDNPAILYNIAYTLKKLNRVEDALPYYERVLTLNPDHAEAHFSHGLALLVTGDRYPNNWHEGWAEYEWRWKRDGKQTLRTYAQPMWDGSDLSGKTLYIWAEQGLGDTFEFVRYAQYAKKMGAHQVIVGVQKPLIDIIGLCPYIDKVQWWQEQPSYFDYHVPLLSMPYLTKARLDSVPNEVPYLEADPELVAEWHEILKPDRNFKIGICWQGNPNYSTQFLRMAVAAKSMSVEKFLPIMNTPGVSVYSLQKMTGTSQLADLPDDAPLILFDDDFDSSKGRFMDTAAVIKNLDLVISIDTSICHLAAGLGVPTWNLLPNPPDWRWMLDCDSTPWYPNMRLFRQPIPGDWDSVIDHVIQELQAFLQKRKPLIYFEHPLES